MFILSYLLSVNTTIDSKQYQAAPDFINTWVFLFIQFGWIVDFFFVQAVFSEKLLKSEGFILEGWIQELNQDDLHEEQQAFETEEVYCL